MFIHFIEQLEKRLLQPLPGEEIQLLMAPYNRITAKQLDHEIHNPRKSAVLILLFPEENKIKTLLIQRPVYEGVHSGQISFPGGKFEDKDEVLEQTALRETFEEVGIIPDAVKIIGKLSDLYILPSNFLVSPFIGYIKDSPDFNIDSYEVQRTITVDVFTLNDKNIISEKIITHSGDKKIKTPYYEIEGFTVWGATAMMISELNAVIQEVSLISF